MIQSLRGSGIQSKQADVAIVGAGIAGLALASQLADKGLRVIVCEAGDLDGTGQSEGLSPFQFARNRLGSASDGRSSGVGGTSALWGGALLPPQQRDLEQAQWPLDWKSLSAHFNDVEQLFALPDGPFDTGEILQEEPNSAPRMVMRQPKWPAFARRNIARLLSKTLKNHANLDIWAHACPTGMDFDANGRALKLNAAASDGSRLSISAREFVFCAGLAETTRLILSFNRDHDGRLLGEATSAGRYLFDHLSAHAANLAPDDKRALEQLSAFRFVRSGMRSVRFEPLQEEGVPDWPCAGLAQLLFWSETDGPFEALRDIYRGFQKRALPGIAQVSALAKGLPWFVRAASARFLRGVLLPPPQARYALNLSIEQEAVSENRIYLGAERDQFGVSTAIVDWGPSQKDMENFEAFWAGIDSFWKDSSCNRAGALTYRPESLQDILDSTGTNHACGTLRMGSRASEGVVDADLRLFGCKNISVASTAVLPRMGGANPTFLLLALTIRLAKRLAASR